MDCEQHACLAPVVHACMWAWPAKFFRIGIFHGAIGRCHPLGPLHECAVMKLDSLQVNARGNLNLYHHLISGVQLAAVSGESYITNKGSHFN